MGEVRKFSRPGLKNLTLSRLNLVQHLDELVAGDGAATPSIEPWTGEVSCSVVAPGTEIPVGFDLTNVKDIWVHFRRRSTSGPSVAWPVVGRVPLRHVIRNVTQGFMIPHFDNDYLSMHLNDGDLANGILRFRSNFSGSDPGFRFQVTEIEFDYGGFILL